MATTTKKLTSPRAQPRSARFKEIEYPTIYSNMMAVGATPFDIAIIFGEIDNASNESIVATPLVKMLLAPEQAANLVKMVTAILENFVENNGKLRTAGSVIVQEAKKHVVQ